MLIKKKVFFLLICITLLSFALTGCYDLGDATEDDEDYCATYSEIRLIKGADDVSYYTMEDFYNKGAVNDFQSPMEEDERGEYSYLIIKVEKALSVGEIAVHFESTVSETLSVSFFVLNESELPTKIYTGPDGTYPKEDCDEPDSKSALGSASCKLAGVKGKWKAIYQRSWMDGDTAVKRRKVEIGQYIVLRINNNCYDPALAAFESAESEWNRVKAVYEQRSADYQRINGDSSSTVEERDAAMAELRRALAAKNVAERDYEAAQAEYENNKSPYKKVSVRMTAILINAE